MNWAYASWGWWRWWRVGAFACSACLACTFSLAPETQALVIVDTDLPAALATELRIDFFSSSGVWFATRDVARASARDWPASFGVLSPSGDDVLIRLRVYPQGSRRDYRGERFAEIGDRAEAAALDGPTLRLVDGGTDRTPPSEPHPDLTIDRMVRVTFARDQKRLVRVTLNARCAGTMAQLAIREGRLDATETRSCRETSGEHAPIEVAQPVDDAALSRSDVGRWGAAPCEVARVGQRTCVPGGAFVFGSNTESDNPLEGQRRITRLDRFFMDRHEVTVGEYRAAIAAGFVPPSPAVVAEGPLVADPVDGCVFTSTPRDRESLAMSCVSWDTARAYCQFMGGDLPTEAQWEYAASVAGRSAAVTFPWGDEAPTCDRAAYGRAYVAPAAGACQALGSGPLPVGVPELDRNALGLSGMSGGVAEWMRDVATPFDSPCLSVSPLENPTCERGATAHSVRGGAWSAPPPALRSTFRRGSERGNASIGIRCVTTG